MAEGDANGELAGSWAFGEIVSRSTLLYILVARLQVVGICVTMSEACCSSCFPKLSSVAQLWAE
jgi:hypothetical protein